MLFTGLCCLLVLRIWIHESLVPRTCLSTLPGCALDIVQLPMPVWGVERNGVHSCVDIAFKLYIVSGLRWASLEAVVA